MSYIKPKQYYQIVEQMAESYARLRDCINDGSAFTEVTPSTWDDLTDITNGTTGSSYLGAAADGDTKLRTNIRDFAENIVLQVVSQPDDNSDGDANASVVHSSTRDPIGSIASDLGRKFTDFSAQFTESKAKAIAASYFATALKALNSHVIARTPLPPSPQIPSSSGDITTIRNINEYYSAYSDDPRAFGDSDETNNEMGLFTWQADSTGDYFTGGYFSANFVELCAQNSITVNAEFQAATYA